MGHVGDKFLAGILLHLHPLQHPVIGFRQQLRLRVVRNGNIFLHEGSPHLLQRGGYLAERLYQQTGSIKSRRQYNQRQHNLKHKHGGAQLRPACTDIICGNADDHNSFHLQRYPVPHRNRHFQEFTVAAVTVLLIPLKAPQHFLGDNHLSLVNAVGILDNAEIAVDNYHPAPVETAQLGQLRLNQLRPAPVHIAGFAQLIRDHLALAAYLGGSL